MGYSYKDGVVASAKIKSDASGKCDNDDVLKQSLEVGVGGIIVQDLRRNIKSHEGFSILLHIFKFLFHIKGTKTKSGTEDEI